MPDSAAITKLHHILSSSGKICGFTGAGISTESGISDYRSKGGLWDRFQPVYFQEFLSDLQKRTLYWERKVEMWPSIRDAVPNPGHVFFKKLYDEKKLIGMITQNIDGLHEKSGLPRDIVVNLHGSNLDVRCLNCSARRPTTTSAEFCAPSVPTSKRATGSRSTVAKWSSCRSSTINHQPIDIT